MKITAFPRARPFLALFLNLPFRLPGRSQTKTGKTLQSSEEIIPPRLAGSAGLNRVEPGSPTSQRLLDLLPPLETPIVAHGLKLPIAKASRIQQAGARSFQRGSVIMLWPLPILPLRASAGTRLNPRLGQGHSSQKTGAQ